MRKIFTLWNKYLNFRCLAKIRTHNKIKWCCCYCFCYDEVDSLWFRAIFLTLIKRHHDWFSTNNIKENRKESQSLRIQSTRSTSQIVYGTSLAENFMAFFLSTISNEIKITNPFGMLLNYPFRFKLLNEKKNAAHIMRITELEIICWVFTGKFKKKIKWCQLISLEHTTYQCQAYMEIKRRSKLSLCK